MNHAAPEPAPTYLQIRERIFHLDPTELGLNPTASAPDVWGVVVEIGYDVGSATLVALADGTTSLHYSTGGGLVGRGDYPPLAEASKLLVAEAQKYLPQLEATKDLPLPEIGQVRFILLTYAGFYMAGAPEKLLAADQHALSPLFTAAQETLAQLRVLADKRRK